MRISVAVTSLMATRLAPNDGGSKDVENMSCPDLLTCVRVGIHLCSFATQKPVVPALWRNWLKPRVPVRCLPRFATCGDSPTNHLVIEHSFEKLLVLQTSYFSYMNGASNLGFDVRDLSNRWEVFTSIIILSFHRSCNNVAIISPAVRTLSLNERCRIEWQFFNCISFSGSCKKL